MITVDMVKAKNIAHQRRRDARTKEFKPYDEIIMKQIPGNDSVQAELARQAIREKYADLQIQIDAAQTAEELKQITPQVTYEP
jgi:hypothetical protein